MDRSSKPRAMVFMPYLQVRSIQFKAIVHDYLREKDLLLILDICEHLVEASAKVTDEFLHIAPKIRIMVSSRETLGIYGETVYRVLPWHINWNPWLLSQNLFNDRKRRQGYLAHLRLCARELKST
jgi:hypothetical protein